MIKANLSRRESRANLARKASKGLVHGKHFFYDRLEKLYFSIIVYGCLTPLSMIS
jgi:hypothetical protein